MRIGRNDRCPCGSGLKYKKCCLNKPKHELLKITPAKKEDGDIFFSRFDRIELVKTFSALSIIPENHGKNIRLEELVIHSLIEKKIGTGSPTEMELKKFFGKNFVEDAMEDICVNTFTDLITFHGGDYIIFPGITEDGQQILSNQLGSIFHMPGNKIPSWFKSNTMMVTLFMLGISDLIATRLGYGRYMESAVDENKIFVPDEHKLREIKESITITNQEMQSFLEREKISPDVVEMFTIDPDKELGEYSLDPYSNLLLYKPILKTEEGYVIVSPSTICLALSGFIWNMAKKGGIMEEVNTTYHAFTWNNVNFELKKLGFNYIEIPEVKLEDHMKAGFYKFDDDKIAFIRYVSDSGKYFGDNESGFGGFASLEGIGKPNDVIEALRKIPHYKNFKIFSISILSGIGGEMMYSIMDDGADRVLALPIQELNTMAQLTTIDALDMWKFATARDKIAKSNPLFFSLSALDLMKVFRENSDSFYLSDDSTSTVPYVEPGYARDWYLDAKLRSDKHSVLRRNGNKYSFAGVELKDSFMPIYYNLHDVSIGNPSFAIGGYSQPIWVMPANMPDKASSGLKSMYLHVSEGIGYWLWQIQDHIKDLISNL
ncbi:MAG: YecA family protein, partial [Chryseobacterium taeanense]